MTEKEQAAPGDQDFPEVEVTMNQVVAYNIKYFRLQRRLTQEQLGRRLEVLTGRPWSKATVSAAERTWDGNRIRQFDADDLIALSGALGYPLNSLFLPPDEDGSVRYRFKGVVEAFRDALADYNEETDEETAARINPSGSASTLAYNLFEGMEDSEDASDQAYVKRVDALFDLIHYSGGDHTTLLSWEVSRSDPKERRSLEVREAEELRKQANVLRVLLRNIEGAAKHYEERFDDETISATPGQAAEWLMAAQGDDDDTLGGGTAG